MRSDFSLKTILDSNYGIKSNFAVPCLGIPCSGFFFACFTAVIKLDTTWDSTKRTTGGIWCFSLRIWNGYHVLLVSFT